MAVTINKLNGVWADVILSPPIDGSKQLVINYNNDVARVRLVDDPATLDMVKIYMVDGEVLELHFSVGVTIDGNAASSNQEIVDLLKTMFTS